MKKNLLYTALGLMGVMGVMGALSLGVVNAAETRVIPGTQDISYTLNGDEEHPFTAKTLTITDCDAENPTEGCTTITILDRNLGATAVGTGCEDSTRGTECMNGTEDETYGYHFQWGNNHGFKPNFNNDDSFPGDEESKNYDVANVDASDYGPGNYYSSSTFITDYSWSNNGDWSVSRNDNLRGGSLTETTDGVGNTVDIRDADYLNGTDWKVDESTVTDRRGPCPEGFHVPSAGELAKLVKMFGLDSEWSNFKEVGRAMHSQLKIPFAGYRLYGSVYGMGRNAFLWSSSPYSASYPYSRIFSLTVGGLLEMFDQGRAEVYSVRCFYDSYQTFTQSFTLSFTGSEGGSVSTGSIEAEKGSSISRDDEVGTVSISGTVVAIGISDEGYSFSGWLTDCDGGTVTTGCSFTGVFKLETYTITYELNGGINSENNLTGYTIKDTITFENPTKEGYAFDGWFTDAQFTTGITSISTGTTGPITVYAKWTENKKSSGSSGGGGRSSKTSDDEKDDINNPSVTDDSPRLAGQDSLESGAQGDSNDDSPLSRGDTASAERGSTQNYTQEFQEAYEFAHEKGITTMPNIQEAQMDGKLTRIAMAKMLSQYAMSVLGQKPANIVTPKFNDVTDKQNSDYNDGVSLAYQLGIMGQNMPDNKFRPNDEVTRAEFATALSRMLYHTSDGEYKSTDKYYTNHMKKLVQEKIITNDDAKMKELRGYVMIMLMRSAGK